MTETAVDATGTQDDLDPCLVARSEAASGRPGSDATLDRVRAKILSGELAPGAVVSQLQLARDLGVSTTPLREALRQLQSEGLLENELNRRPRVTALDVEDLHAVYSARILLESLAVAMTVPLMDDEMIAALKDDLAQMRALATMASLDAWAAVHTGFHRRLVAGAPRGSAATLSNFFDRAERYRRLSAAGDQPRGWVAADREHELIVNACAAGDAGGAAREVAHHLARTALLLSSVFAPEVDPIAVRLALRMASSLGPAAADGDAEPARRRRRPS